MSRNRDSVKHQLRVAAEYGKIRNTNTKHLYNRAFEKFSAWAKTQGIRDASTVTAEVIQNFERSLEADPRQYSPATIHGYLAPVCRAAGVPMDAIRKPKRTAAKIRRSRWETANQQGKREAEKEENRRLIEFQKAVGIRRSELARLRGKDLVREGNQIYVFVERGKGGKRQKQWILSADRATVIKTFSGVGPEDPVFSRAEMNNHIDLHGLRAEHARRCYRYYAEMIKASHGGTERLREALLRRFDAEHTKMRENDPQERKKNSSPI
jgi:site-specific recombinase XerD